MTILLTPFMSCSAKLPIYALFHGGIFPETRGTGDDCTVFWRNCDRDFDGTFACASTLFQGEAGSFCHGAAKLSDAGSQKCWCICSWDKAKDFLQRAFTVIFMATLVIWFLQTFDLHLNMVQRILRDSHTCAGWPDSLAFLFAPMGFGDWRISTALITGFMAKESVVSTLSVLFGSTGALQTVLTPLSAASLLVFCLLYTPCVAAIASIRRELGGKWAVFVVVGQCVIAWIAAFVVYQVGHLFI